MKIAHICWISRGDQEDAVLAYAARELARYGRALTGATWDVQQVEQAGQQAGTIWLGICDQMPAVPGNPLTPDPWDDGLALWADKGAGFIAGRNARSVLFGVYAFLERAGVRFLRPGPDGEIIPHIDDIPIPAAPLVEMPRYRHRGVCIEGAPSVEHALGMIDWCAKKRMNTLFLQFLSSRYFYNLWYERTYNPPYADHTITEPEALAMDDRVIAEAKQRGMVVHRVGHGWTSAAFGLPRSGWVQAEEAVPPEYVRWLAEVGGERKLYRNIPINTELCYSYQPAFDAFVETIVRYCEAHPELDVVHVWLSDATNNKCECAECRKLSISDWYVRIINALSESLHRRVPQMRFVFLCYIELLWPPEQLQIDEQYGNAILMFAPIARCYGHALDDPACDDGHAWPRPPLNQYAVSRHNAFYTEVLAGWREAFRGDSFDFDYHAMWAIWSQLTDTQVARVYHQDLQQLKRLGLDGIVSCQSFRAFYPSGLAMTAMAESLWDPSVPWAEMRRRYLEAAYGKHSSLADHYLETVEGYLDTGDPHWRTLPLSNASAEKLATFAAFLDTSLTELATRQGLDSDAARTRSLDLLAHHAQFLRYVVQGHQARLAGEPEQADRAFDQAADFLRRTEPETSTFIDTMLALRFLDRARQPA
jgi:hypothetical protein